MSMHFQKTVSKEMKRKKSQEKLLFSPFSFSWVHSEENVLKMLIWCPLPYLCYISGGKVVFHSLYEFYCSSGSYFKVNKGESVTEVNKKCRFFYHTWKITYSKYLIKLSWKPRLCWIITSGCSSHWESLGSFEVCGSVFSSDRELWGFLTERK